MNKPAILVTNDDGIQAPGLAALVDALASVGDVTVYATPVVDHLDLLVGGQFVEPARGDPSTRHEHGQDEKVYEKRRARKRSEPEHECEQDHHDYRSDGHRPEDPDDVVECRVPPYGLVETVVIEDGRSDHDDYGQAHDQGPGRRGGL